MGPPARLTRNTPTALPAGLLPPVPPGLLRTRSLRTAARSGRVSAQTPQPDPAGQSRALAIWSIVFAFVFAPVGAVLGHLALGQIRRGLQRGRDLALVGLTLSYTFIVLTVAGLAMWMVTGAYTGGPTVADRPDVIAVPDPAHTETPSARPAPDALTGVLLSLDELKSILKAPGLAETPSSSGESQGGDGGGQAVRGMRGVAAAQPSPAGGAHRIHARRLQRPAHGDTGRSGGGVLRVGRRRPGLRGTERQGNGGGVRGSPSASRRRAGPG